VVESTEQGVLKFTLNPAKKVGNWTRKIAKKVEKTLPWSPWKLWIGKSINVLFNWQYLNGAKSGNGG